jgi:hypothetical protein
MTGFEMPHGGPTHQQPGVDVRTPKGAAATRRGARVRGRTPPLLGAASVSLLAVASVALASSIALSLAACQGRAAAESGHEAGHATPSLAAAATPTAPPSERPDPASARADGAAAKADGPQQGQVVSEEPYSTWLQAPAPVGVGAPAQIEAVLVAKAPYHCNPDYPHKFKLNAAPAGLSYPEELVRGMQVSPERGVLRIPVLAKSAGPATVSGTLSFSVCNDERCLVEKKELSLALQVK